MKLQDPECMAAIKVYGYLNKPSTKSRRFVILPPGIVHSTRSKLVSTCFAPKVSKFYAEKGYLASKCHHWQVYFTDQKIRQMGDP